jgi:hypothetical protein
LKLNTNVQHKIATSHQGRVDYTTLWLASELTNKESIFQYFISKDIIKHIDTTLRFIFNIYKNS